MSGRRTRRRSLGEGSETWQVARLRLRTWVREADGELHRPWLMIVIGVPSGLVLAMNVEEKTPAPERVRSLLDQAIVRPQAGPPGRPDRVICAEPELATAIAPWLEAHGITGRLGETPELQEVVESLEEHLRDGPLLPGLLDTPGVTPNQVGNLFAAAAYFYREAPWRFVSDEHPLVVRFPADSTKDRYVIVMGNGGIEFGLAVYRSAEQLAVAYSDLLPEVQVTLFDQESITYGEIQDLAFSDLDAFEQNNWEGAGPKAYPLPLLFTRQEQARRPSQEDLRWYVAALRAVPRFVGEQLKTPSGVIRPAEATLNVSLGDGEASVYLRYPPNPIPRSRRPRRRR